MPEETILAFPGVTKPMRHARSTILLGSMAAIRASGRWEGYVAALPPQHRAALLDAVAGTWIPVDIALAHYRTCDALELPTDEQVENGRRTFDRAGATIFGTITKMARATGVTPWTVFPHLQRFWERGYDGGGVAVFKLGPKEARVEAVRVALLESRYYRHALRGLLGAVVEQFCTRAYLSERARTRGPDSVIFRIQWA